MKQCVHLDRLKHSPTHSLSNAVLKGQFWPWISPHLLQNQSCVRLKVSPIFFPFKSLHCLHPSTCLRATVNLPLRAACSTNTTKASTPFNKTTCFPALTHDSNEILQELPERIQPFEGQSPIDVDYSTVWTTSNSWFDSRKGNKRLLSATRPFLWLPQSNTQIIKGLSWPGLEADHSALSSVEVYNDNDTSYSITVTHLINRRSNFILKCEADTKCAHKAHPSLSHSLNTWSKILLEKLTVPQQLQKFPVFYVNLCSLPYSQEPVTSTYPEPDQSSLVLNSYAQRTT